jgi:SAM-dependent methyltransferase
MDAYSACIWELQQPLLAGLLRRHQAELRHPLTLLDFACGTGQMLSQVESLALFADGINPSADANAVAQTRCKLARLQAGNRLTEPGLFKSSYDVITAFRFLSAAQPDVRRHVLRRFREIISVPHGLLVIDAHGRSWRHSSLERAGRPGATPPEMSPAETRRLLWGCGFQIVRQYGFGILPDALYRTPLRPAAFAVDRLCAARRWSRDWAMNLTFVCRPI